MTSLSSRSLNGMGQCTIIRFRCSQMTLRLNQFARVVLIFDERELRPDLMFPSLCVGIASRTVCAAHLIKVS
jgi:hypothetical protein